MASASTLPKLFPGGAKGVSMENLLFSDVVMGVQVPILVSSTWQDDAIGHSENIVHGIRAKVGNHLYMQGNLDFNHYDISIEDSFFELSGYEPMLGSVRPCGVFLNNMKDITFKNVKLRWKNPVPDCQNSLIVNNCPGLRLIDCDFQEPPNYG